MRTFTKEIVQEPKNILFYECDICKRKSPERSFIEDCELRHKQETCKHPNYFYKFFKEEKPDNAYWMEDYIYNLAVITYCLDCSMEILDTNQINLKDFEDDKSFMDEIVKLYNQYRTKSDENW